MLLSFRFANHRSFRSEQQLLLTRTYGRSGDDYADALPVIGIFGANASGKSNALNALAYMRKTVIQSDRDVEPGLGLQRDPFRLDPSGPDEASRYVVDLAIDGVRYTYGFTLDSDRILEEWLYRYKKRKVTIFEREGDDIKISPSKLAEAFDPIARITAPTALFISVAARFASRRGWPSRDQSSEFHAVYQWFLSRLITAAPGVPGFRLQTRFEWAEDAAQRETVIELLRAADIGLVDVILKRPDGEQEELFPDPREDDYIETISGRRIRYTRSSPPRPRLLFTHKGSIGDVALDLSDESNGTRTLLDLSVRSVRSLTRGGLLLVDEIDASLHPMLTAKLINLFQSSTTNPRGAQLVFSSHDATLLGVFDGREVLQRDQVWFAEKSDDGSSILFPLSDFHPRRDGENRQRRYLNGNYGAVPELSQDLFEQAILARGLLSDSEIGEKQGK